MHARGFPGSKAVDDLQKYGNALSATVSQQQAENIANGLLEKRRLSVVPDHLPVKPRIRHMKRRVALAFMTLGLFALANVSLAAVSDRAAPGDFLYAIDRGYEWLGDIVGPTDRISERLVEANQLNERGETTAAVDLLLDTLVEGSSDDALLIATIQSINEASDQGQGSGTDSPSSTAPGQTGDVPRGNANGNSGPVSPSETAPGQIEDGSPSDNAPGQSRDPAPTGQSPSATAPGQVGQDQVGQDQVDSPSATAPGQNRTTTTAGVVTTTTAPGPSNGPGNSGGNGSGNANPNGNGNNGNG